MLGLNLALAAALLSTLTPAWQQDGLQVAQATWPPRIVVYENDDKVCYADYRTSYQCIRKRMRT